MFFEKRLRTFIVISALIVVLCSSWPTQACTLWAACGDKVRGGGTLIAKNRDWKPDQRNVLKLVTSGDGFRYYGLFAEGEGKSKLRAGMNERGLVVISASPPFTDEKLRSMPSKGVMREILSRCNNMKQAFALVHNTAFLAPGFLLLADRQGIGSIEIGPKGKNAVQVAKDGVMYHTNHYLDSELTRFNPSKLGRSTIEREERIKQFLTEENAYALKDFIRMSHSKEGGPNNSIWREGRTPTSARTVASWIVWQPRGRPAEIYVRLANPGEKTKDVRLEWPSAEGKPGYVGSPVRVEPDQAEPLDLMGIKNGRPGHEADALHQYDETGLAREIMEGDFDDLPDLTEE